MTQHLLACAVNTSAISLYAPLTEWLVLLNLGGLVTRLRQALCGLLLSGLHELSQPLLQLIVFSLERREAPIGLCLPVGQLRRRFLQRLHPGVLLLLQCVILLALLNERQVQLVVLGRQTAAVLLNNLELRSRNNG